MSVEGFVLAGGRSSRMGRDKILLLLGGETLVERAVHTLSKVTPRVSIVGDLDNATGSFNVLPDVCHGPKGRGSIVGLYSALYHSTTDWSAILACDLPFANAELFSYLIAQIPPAKDNIGALFLEQPDGRLQPLCGLYRRDRCLAPLEVMLDQDKWRLQDLPEVINARLIRFDEISHLRTADHFFDNVNTHKEYLEARETEKKMMAEPPEN